MYELARYKSIVTHLCGTVVLYVHFITILFSNLIPQLDYNILQKKTKAYLVRPQDKSFPNKK